MPFNASLLAVGAVLFDDMLGMINWFKMAKAQEESQRAVDMVDYIE